METNRKTDWQRFLPINMWCLHLSLRAHINYIVVMWTFKTGNVINLFRVTTGSIWSRGFPTCGIAVRQPRLQRCRRRPRVPPRPASAGRRAAGSSTSASHFWGAALFLFAVGAFRCVQSWETCLELCFAEGCAKAASLPGKSRRSTQRWMLLPSLPFPSLPSSSVCTQELHLPFFPGLPAVALFVPYDPYIPFSVTAVPDTDGVLLVFACGCSWFAWARLPQEAAPSPGALLYPSK